MNIYDLSDEQLSMIASALAVGEVFCCNGRGMLNRETVDSSRRELIAIEEFAQNNMGCGDDRFATGLRARRYLKSFLEGV